MIKDCAKDSKLDKTYSQADLAAALQQMPSDVDEYTDCRDVIRRAELHGGSGGSSGSGGGGTTGSTGTGGSSGASSQSPAEQLAAAPPQVRAALQDAVSHGSKTPVQIGGQTLSPSSLGVGDLAKTHSLPTPLIVVLILLSIAGTAGLIVLRRRRRAFTE